MDPEAPPRGRRRGFRRWFWITLVVIPLTVLPALNLWLSSPRGRNWIAGKIQRQTRLETRVGGTTISPWNGISIREVELLQPPPLRSAVKQPLVRIATIRLLPVWRSWLRGIAEVNSLELDSPQVVIPVELLAELVRAQAPATLPAPPVAAVTPPAVESQPSPPPLVPESPAQAPAISLPPTGWLHLKNASFTLLSAASGNPSLQVSGLSGSIPIAGSPAQSSLRIHAIHLAGRKAVSDLTAPLSWTFPLLSLNSFETETCGLKLTLTARLGMVPGLPLQMEALIPKQKPGTLPLPNDGLAKAETMTANARFLGYLLAPGTWQGGLVAEVLAPSVHIAGHDARFDHGSAITTLRGGVLSCIDARLIGDDLSFLGNATLLADGRTAAALRMVAPPETATAIATCVFPGLPQPPALTPLATPQRAALDLEAFGNISRMFLRLGTDGPIVELKH